MSFQASVIRGHLRTGPAGARARKQRNVAFKERRCLTRVSDGERRGDEEVAVAVAVGSSAVTFHGQAKPSHAWAG